MEMLGVGADPDAARALDRLRTVWRREPSVHGGKPEVMRALGIE